MEKIKLLWARIIRVDKNELPDTDNSRKIIHLEKTNNTPSKYPRKAGIPNKEPIK